MTDRKYGDYSRLLRMPELRMLDGVHDVVRLTLPVELTIEKPGRTCFYYLKKGRLRFYPHTASPRFHDIAAGTAIGLEDGASHRWTSAADHLKAHDVPADQDEVELICGDVDRRYTFIQRLMNVLVIMPGDAEPHASMLRHCVELIEINQGRPQPNPAIGRRIAELISLELLLYAEDRLKAVGPIPESVQHDAALLRGWTAFLNDPANDWTLQSLADAAGISRTAFSKRFRAIIGTTPLAAVRQIRVRYAADMLRSTQAPVAEIALQVGYGSDIALMRAFRKELGMTPARWRDSATKG